MSDNNKRTRMVSFITAMRVTIMSNPECNANIISKAMGQEYNLRRLMALGVISRTGRTSDARWSWDSNETPEQVADRLIEATRNPGYHIKREVPEDIIQRIESLEKEQASLRSIAMELIDMNAVLTTRIDELIKKNC